MGHRCNLVVKRGGTVEIYYSHWGALSLLADVLKGPGAFGDWLKDCKREQELLDSVWSEGIALADFDDELLLLRGGIAVRYILPVRHAYLEMARTSWPRWRVEWAHRGVVDVARHVGLATPGLDRKPLVCPSDAELRKAGSFSWVTVVEEATADFPFGQEPAELMLLGPTLLEYCKERPPGRLPAEDQLGGGLLLKPGTRYLGWWSAGELRPATADAAWPGWQVQELSQALRDQAVGSDRDPSALILSTDRVRKYIADELFPGVQPDPVASMRRLEASLRQAGQGPMLNPEALKYPRPE